MGYRRIIVVIMTLFAFNGIKAQDWEIGASVGASGYMGELNPDNPFLFNDWSGGFLLKRNLNQTWSLSLNLLRANIWGEGANSNKETIARQRLQFQTPLYELSTIAEFNFFKFEPSYSKNSYTPYIFAGIGAVHFQPKNYNFDGELVNLRDFETEGVRYNSIALIIPFGVGFKYNLRGPLTLGVALGYRVAFTDYLDDVSGDYLRIDEIADLQRRAFIDPSDVPKYSNEYTQRGDGRAKDSYMLLNFTITYAIFKSGCPIFTRK